MILYKNIKQVLSLAGVRKKKGRKPTTEDLGIVDNACIAVNQNNEILWVGKNEDFPSDRIQVEETLDCSNEVWLPGLVECHTHLVFAGSRWSDYQLRCEGKTYKDIAEKGGGILSTIRPTRAASISELVSQALPHIEYMENLGVSALEIKSGYGLSFESEIKILETILELRKKTRVILIPTFLPAHALPPEFKNKRQDYVEAICKEWLPYVAQHRLAHFFDAFIEEGFFTKSEAQQMAETALAFGLKVKFHTDQFTDQGGTSLGLELKCQSLDHLEKVSEENIKKIGNSETVAVLCPGASLFTHYDFPPARKLINAGSRVAISTDFNPGTCPSRNLLLMTTLACSQMGMTIEESIAGITYNAAAALGIEERIGTIEVGQIFKVARFKTESYQSIPYSFGEIETAISH